MHDHQRGGRQDAGVLLRLALHGTETDCVAETGWSQDRVVQAAIVAAHDNKVAAAWPDEAAAVRARVARQSAARREGARRLRR